MSGPSEESDKRIGATTRNGELPCLDTGSKPASAHFLTDEISEYVDRDSFLVATSVDNSPQVLHRLLAPKGFDFSQATRIVPGETNLAYADLYIGKGPDGREVVAKIVGGNSRDMFSGFGDNLAKDVETLSRAARAGIHELPKLLAIVDFKDGHPAAVIMEQVDFVPEDTLLHSLGRLSPEECAEVEQKLKSFYRRISETCGLALWDFQPGDVILKKGPSGIAIRILDGGSFEINQEASHELRPEIAANLERLLRTGTFSQEVA